jgi:hypothetical protein
MQEMSFWQLVENSPEWVGVLANALFAIVTIYVVYRQVRVMEWQNNLVRLQYEHEWLLRLNEGREQVLKLGRKLHRYASGVKEKPQSSDQRLWAEVQETVGELDARLNILDVSAYSGQYDNWFPRLSEYVGAVRKAVIADYEFKTTYSVDDGIPSLSTRKTLKEAEHKNEPINILLDLEAAIRMEFFDFKTRWDAALG